MKTYHEWLKRVKQEDNPDRYVLETLCGVVEQYRTVVGSITCQSLLERASKYVSQYLEEEDRKH